MQFYDEDKPCTFDTPQGFCVKYKDRLLYSKYKPKERILAVLSNLNILPGTLFLCISPCLGYGLEELAGIMPNDCRLIGVEADLKLYEFTEQNTKSLKCTKEKKFILEKPENLRNLPEKIYSSMDGTIKRAVKIDFSGGSYFYQKFYAELDTAVANAIGSFWKNRITLVKFGRLYAKNMFLNMTEYSSSKTIYKIDKPIIVCGAGESLTYTLNEIYEIQDNFFIIAVDAALNILKKSRIKVDMSICEEAQSVITGAFLGTKDYAGCCLSAISSFPHSWNFIKDKRIFYTSEFCNANFLKKLQEKRLIPFSIPPLGSVGLSATYLALTLRKDIHTPVFITGLDFSYSVGNSHAKGAFHDINYRIKTFKLNTVGNFKPAFGFDSKKIIGKNKKTAITNTKLYEYAKLFEYTFSETKNLFDAGISGIELGLEHKNPLQWQLEEYKSRESIKSSIKNTYTGQIEFSEDLKKQIKHYFEDEQAALFELKEILKGNISLEKEERNKKILSLIESREYLYYHFPDGIKMSLEISFLKRIRVEISYFLKIFNLCLKRL